MKTQRRREGRVSVNDEEVGSVNDGDFNVIDGLPTDWWTDERHVRCGRHERDDKGNLVTIEAHVITRGICRNKSDLDKINSKAVNAVNELYLELSLMWYEDLA